jgi:hypothetical protein
MPQIAIDPATGRLTLDGQVLDRNDRRLFGRVGRNVTEASTGDVTGIPASAYDPNYYEPFTNNEGDAGQVTRYRLRPDVAERLGGRIQLGQSGVGGHGELNDAANAEWSDEFGILARPDDVNAPDDSGIQGAMANYIIPAATIAAMGYGAGSMAGLWGAPGAAGAAPAASAIPEVAIPGNLSAATIPAASPALAAIPGGGGGSGFLSTLGNALSGGGAGLGDVVRSGASAIGDAITSNPLGALRTAGGLAAIGAGMRGASGGSGGGGGGVGDMQDILDAQANANRYDWNTPFGSRRWSQGEDGRWTVNDSLSPEEQANYEGVRSMNAGATDYARQLLARTMARPQRDHLAELPATNSYFSRWRG